MSEPNRATEHISIRVPWHDGGWNGTICQDPSGNGTCVLLKNIGQKRRDTHEQRLASATIADLALTDAPPCVAERATFMSPRPIPFERSHPFAEKSKAFAPFRPTRQPLPPFSAQAVPFHWMSRDGAKEIAKDRQLGLRPELEEAVDAITTWRDSNWVMHGDNQESLLDTFFSTVQPEASLVFFYAKHSPLSDDPRRLLVGAATVTRITPTGAYRSDGNEQFPAQMWETTVEHSLRPDQQRGFLLPYQALLAARDRDGVDVSDALAFAPEAGWTAFSYVTEHVSHDLAIDALLSLAAAGRQAQQILGSAIGPIGFDWLEAQLNRLWKLRGPCPGLGSALAAFGVTQAITFAHMIAASEPAFTYRAPSECYWPNDELEHYFAPYAQAWFVHERYAEYKRDITELGVAEQARVYARLPDPSGRVLLRNAHSDHSRGLNGFDPELRIAGFDAALAHPDLRRSAFIWNRLLAPRADRLRGIVESASRADYTNGRRLDQDTEPQRLATERAWLPAPGGGYARPSELALDDLPPDFVHHQGLADKLRMVTSAIQQASNELGIPIDLLRYLSDNPELLADVRSKIAQPAAGDPVGLQVGPPEGTAIDYPASLQEAFTRPNQRDGLAEEEGLLHRAGQVIAPALRRERTAEVIRQAQAAEPGLHERFRLLPRKVWDGKDPAVRQFLLEQYAGRCQICSYTFPKRDGTPYFEVVYLVSRTDAAWIDRYGNVLCLCPTCASKFLYGEIQAEDVLDQIRSWRPEVEGGDGSTVRLTLCGESKIITYTEKHLFDLQTMLTL